AEIHRQRMEAIGKMGSNKIPPMAVGRAAVDEENRRLALAAVVDAVEIEAVDEEFALSHLVSGDGEGNFESLILRASILCEALKRLIRDAPTQCDQRNFQPYFQ